MKRKGKIVVSIEARYSASRLPGKVLREITGVPMLELMIERVRQARRVDEIVLATTVNPKDEPLVSLAKKLGIACYRGSEEDVLDRVLKAVWSVNGEHIVELWGDNPLLDPALIDQAVSFYMSGELDCVGTHLNKTYPYGMSLLVFSAKVLEEVNAVALDPVYRENVSNYIYEHPARYTTGHLACPDEFRRPDVRLTVDEAPDFELVSRIFEALRPVNPAFGLKDILAFLDSHPELKDINRCVRQRRPATASEAL